MSSVLKISADFDKATGQTPELASRAAVKITLGATNLTQFAELDDRRIESDHLDIPTYYLAEWLAENWWALLHEPRKSEDNEEDGPDFLSRHSFLYAQQGYSLPNIKIVSNGRRAISVSAVARNVPLADVRFLKAASLMLPPASVAEELKRFISQTVESLNRHGLDDTELHDAWELLSGTSRDEELYCKMIGALGLSPYEDNRIDDLLFKLVEEAGERVTMDLCLVAKPEEFRSFASRAISAYKLAGNAAESDLSALESLPPVPDRLTTPAWKRGVQYADRMRQHLGLNETNPASGIEALKILGIDLGNKGSHTETPEQQKSDEGMPIVGAVVRDHNKAKIGLLQTTVRGRRFSAARGAFAVLISSNSESRLLTQAVTRDQQSSRAFAAELLAPISFLRKEAGPSRKLVNDQINDLADELGVYPGLVWKQAQNNGLTVKYH